MDEYKLLKGINFVYRLLDSLTTGEGIPQLSMEKNVDGLYSRKSLSRASLPHAGERQMWRGCKGKKSQKNGARDGGGFKLPSTQKLEQKLERGSLRPFIGAAMISLPQGPARTGPSIPGYSLGQGSKQALHSSGYHGNHHFGTRLLLGALQPEAAWLPAVLVAQESN